MKFFVKILISAGIVLFLACKEKNVHIKQDLGSADFLLNLPDSIKIDSTIKGFIKYKLSDSPLIGENVDKRYTFLYATISSKRVNSIDELKKIPHDTFVTIEKNIIPIYKMQSLEKGNVIFNGFLSEQFFYRTSEDSTRIITKERRFEKTIKVY